MTTGELLYLIICLAAFGVLSAVLAHYSRQQSREGRETVSAPARNPEPHDTITA
jgi:Flp pilus assembly protein CpaB